MVAWASPESSLLVSRHAAHTFIPLTSGDGGCASPAWPPVCVRWWTRWRASGEFEDGIGRCGHLPAWCGLSHASGAVRPAGRHCTRSVACRMIAKFVCDDEGWRWEDGRLGIDTKNDMGGGLPLSKGRSARASSWLRWRYVHGCVARASLLGCKPWWRVRARCALLCVPCTRRQKHFTHCKLRELHIASSGQL